MIRPSLVAIALFSHATLAAEAPPTVRVAAAQAFAALSVADLAASSRWYETHFGLARGFSYTSEDGAVRIQVLSRPGLTIELQQQAAAQPLAPTDGKAFLRHGIFKFGIGVLDLRAAVARLEAAGVRVLVAPFEDQDGRVLAAVIMDDSGNWLQLTEARPSAR
jgi:catechol 2,3-dioxygenase-like lactoylglutathione lyase family enzyme